jgi:two-component system, NtrC family, sensor kinase
MFRARRTHGKLPSVARILVLDDEPMVALVIRRVLEDTHVVEVEHSACAAVDRFARGDRFDALIADLHLADGDAIWVRDQLLLIDPALPSRMLVLTGGASSEAGQAFLREPGVRWLQKPFRPAELLSRLEEVLRSSIA